MARLGRQAAGRAGPGDAETCGPSQSDIPSGIRLLEVLLDVPGLLGQFAGFLGVGFERQREYVAGLGAGGQQRPGEVDRLAVVGQEDGDRFLLAFKAIEGQAGGHAVFSLRSPDNYWSLRDLLRVVGPGISAAGLRVAHALALQDDPVQFGVELRAASPRDPQGMSAGRQREDAWLGEGHLQFPAFEEDAPAIPNLDDDLIARGPVDLEGTLDKRGGQLVLARDCEVLAVGLALPDNGLATLAVELQDAGLDIDRVAGLEELRGKLDLGDLDLVQPRLARVVLEHAGDG